MKVNYMHFYKKLNIYIATFEGSTKSMREDILRARPELEKFLYITYLTVPDDQMILSKIPKYLQENNLGNIKGCLKQIH